MVTVPPDAAGQDFVGTTPNLNHLLFVPLRWEGTQSAFDDEAETQVNAFLDEIPLSDCREQVDFETLDVSGQNFDDWTCSDDDCAVDTVKTFVREELGIDPTDYDVIIGLAETSPCRAAGCSNRSDTVWVTPGSNTVLAHELGHIFGLEDQYCSDREGMSTDDRCNDGDSQGDGAVTGDVNWLDAGGSFDCPPDGSPDSEGVACCNFTVDCYELLGCTWQGELVALPLGSYELRCSDSDWGEWGIAHVNYGICCRGNKIAGGGRSIMSYASGDDPRHFDGHDLDHLNSLPALQCGTEGTRGADEAIEPVADGSLMIIDVDLAIHPDHSVEENNLSVTYGRPTLESVLQGMSGAYTLAVTDTEGATVWSQAFGVYFDYNGPVFLGVDYSGVSYDSVDVSFRIPYDFWMHTIDLYHGESLIFSKQLPVPYRVYLPVILRAY